MGKDPSSDSSSEDDQHKTEEIKTKGKESADDRAKRITARDKKKADLKAQKEADELKAKEIEEAVAKLHALDPTNQISGAALVRAGIVEPLPDNEGDDEDDDGKGVNGDDQDDDTSEDGTQCPKTRQYDIMEFHVFEHGIIF